MPRKRKLSKEEKQERRENLIKWKRQSEAMKAIIKKARWQYLNVVNYDTNVISEQLHNLGYMNKEETKEYIHWTVNNNGMNYIRISDLIKVVFNA